MEYDEVMKRLKEFRDKYMTGYSSVAAQPDKEVLQAMAEVLGLKINVSVEFV